MVKKLIIGIVGIIVAIGSVVTWYYLPSFYIFAANCWEMQAASSGDLMQAHLVACGERAIDQIIANVKLHSPWIRNYGYLATALKALGEPAHLKLLTAIDDPTLPLEQRVYLISALQRGFSDFSRSHRLVADFPSLPTTAQMYLGESLRNAFPEAPRVIINDSLNQPFMDWLKNQFPAPSPQQQ